MIKLVAVYKIYRPFDADSILHFRGIFNQENNLIQLYHLENKKLVAVFGTQQ